MREYTHSCCFCVSREVSSCPSRRGFFLAVGCPLHRRGQQQQQGEAIDTNADSPRSRRREGESESERGQTKFQTRESTACDRVKWERRQNKHINTDEDMLHTNARDMPNNVQKGAIAVDVACKSHQGCSFWLATKPRHTRICRLGHSLGPDYYVASSPYSKS